MNLLMYLSKVFLLNIQIYKYEFRILNCIVTIIDIYLTL